ncbi:hypothetical protein N9152_00925 [bacterium]|nr:hypothetical protein [bacterium]
MAKTYNLKADADITLTDSTGFTINTFSVTETFSAISSDTVVTGTVSIARDATEQINITTIGTRALVLLKNDNTTGVAKARLLNNATIVTELAFGEWLFMPVDATGTNINVTAAGGPVEITYVIVEQ